MSLVKRLRGGLLRLVLNRPLAMALGLAVAAPAAWLMVADYRWENGLTDGAALVAGATGVALLLAGLGGRRPDWFDPEPAGRESNDGESGDEGNRR